MRASGNPGPLAPTPQSVAPGSPPARGRAEYKNSEPALPDPLHRLPQLERHAAAARRRRLLQIERGAGRGARAPIEHRFLVEHAPPAGQLRGGRAQAAAFALALPAIPDQGAIAEDPHGLLRMAAVERNE